MKFSYALALYPFYYNDFSVYFNVTSSSALVG